MELEGQRLSTHLLGAGLELLRRRRGVTRAKLASRMAVARSTITRMGRGRSMTCENMASWLAALGADLHELADAVAEVTGEGVSPAAGAGTLGELMRPIDLYRDARRLLEEARRLQRQSRSEEIDRAVESLAVAAAELGDLFDREDGIVCRKIARVTSERLTDGEVERALGLLRTLVGRAVAREGAQRGRLLGTPTPCPGERDG